MVLNRFECNPIRLYKGRWWGLRISSDFCTGNDDTHFPLFVITIINALFHDDIIEHWHGSNVTFELSGLTATEK
jgi:hypothetical protein